MADNTTLTMAKPSVDARQQATQPAIYRVFDIPIHDVAPDAILLAVEQALRTGGRARILYVNAHILNLVYEQPELKRFYQTADLVWCDGVGVALLIKALYGHRPIRHTFPDWVGLLARALAQRGHGLFLLGSTSSACQGAVAKLRDIAPGLIIDSHHGYFDKTPGAPDSQAVVRQINASGAKVLLVGFGAPLQEQWIWDHWDALDCAVCIPVGALCDVLSGQTYRAPRWATDRGLEWLSRLIANPRRLWRRYLIGLPVLFSRVLFSRVVFSRVLFSRVLLGRVLLQTPWRQRRWRAAPDPPVSIWPASASPAASASPEPTPSEQHFDRQNDHQP